MMLLLLLAVVMKMLEVERFAVFCTAKRDDSTLSVDVSIECYYLVRYNNSSLKNQSHSQYLYSFNKLKANVTFVILRCKMRIYRKLNENLVFFEDKKMCVLFTCKCVVLGN